MLRFYNIDDIFDYFLNPKHRARIRHEIDDELIDAIESCPTHFAATITGTLSLGLAITETLTTTEQPFIDSGDPAVKASISATAAISGVTVDAAMQKALSAGAVSLDLTSLTSVRGVTGQSFSGLKVKYALLRNPVANANAITATVGASNGAATFGAAWKIVLQPNDYYVAKLANSETVDATHKTWDLTGTGSQALDIILGAG